MGSRQKLRLQCVYCGGQVEHPIRLNDWDSFCSPECQKAHFERSQSFIDELMPHDKKGTNWMNDIFDD